MQGLAQAGSPRNSNAPARATHVTVQHERLDENLKSLSEMVQSLEERLSSVLRGMPSVALDKAQPEEALVPMADHLRMVNSKIVGLQLQIDSILARLEL